MDYKIEGNIIKIKGKRDFNPRHILDCGQIFAYDGNVVYSGKERAEIFENKEGFDIFCSNPEYFENFFDLKTDYGKIKKELSKKVILVDPVRFGYGIRILKNDLFETLISFIISANNNIKRIKMILTRLRENLGEKIGDYHAFPSYEKLLCVKEDFFKEIGCGYRASYLFKVLRQITPEKLESLRDLNSRELKQKLVELAGVGPKVADCIMLFGYGRKDVFPVDTWIHKMYNTYYKKEDNRIKIRENLVKEFGSLSGYAQQYLFFYQRSI